ncbi:hypothetical protein [Gelidibacter salicanalis]|nr:hypothetical protein [Gelidibacter salicanalis]
MKFKTAGFLTYLLLFFGQVGFVKNKTVANTNGVPKVDPKEDSLW